MIILLVYFYHCNNSELRRNRDFYIEKMVSQISILNSNDYIYKKELMKYRRILKLEFSRTKHYGKVDT